ncbi:potassium channel regulatory factor [Hortaea werneckii]|uniref:Pre-mRNA-splicing factor 18 n=1 Tax=Hortaea werneckii TaxID=91943 RepID=A0A3M7IRQ3_HORWE|nr:potassium channel regulatory factor [Hortaea werneckii]KAI6821487.1 potassium channel regulatory factor [Hortaea werneckii]KAI6919804.1 potassium channel regulatory factor [Hortaea werneckii]KAI6930487.1 potassium channel regulatory factor [Hortaea werneckii]KAI6964942.1 potassium channel regulatory factor [Hortaea werneckii]
MDFASLMKSQISSASPKEQPSGGPKKYLKRSEVEAQRQADYHREQEELERARLERLEKKRKWDEEEAERNAARDEKRKRLADDSKRVRDEEEWREENDRRKRIGLPELPAPGSDGDQGTPALKEGEEDIPKDDLLEKLKEMGEPRFLFAESHLQRLRRYRALTSKALAPKLSSGPIPTTLELVEEKHMKIPSHVPQSAEDKAYLRRQLASYFDMVLSEWAQALARRAREVKESLSGRKAQQNYEAAKDNLRPLFRKLETNTLSDSILSAVVEITHLAQLKQYVFANDAYLRLSIGKAAWPIGVTMVGIHERSAREKLHETDKEGKGEAHIMSDEVTRKMLQGIKRCLSFAQTRWPPEDVGQLMG